MTERIPLNREKLILAVSAAVLAVSLMVAAIGGSAAAVEAAKPVDADRPTITTLGSTSWS